MPDARVDASCVNGQPARLLLFTVSLQRWSRAKAQSVGVRESKIHHWRPGFTTDLQQKDLRLVLQEADRLGVPLPGTALIHQLYRTLQARGLGHEGNHALIKALENLAGIEIGVWDEGG